MNPSIYRSDLVVADSRDREEWLRVRSRGVGGSDAASFAKRASVELYVRALLTQGFRGNSNTAAGHRWEPVILAAVGFEQNSLMYRHPENDRFLATPDGIKVEADGSVTLAQAKTKHHDPFDSDGRPRPFSLTNAKGLPHVTPAHRRQVAWEQFVLGAARTRYAVMPIHPRTLQPVGSEVFALTIERDEAIIADLVFIATRVVAAKRAAADFERKLHS